MLKRRFKIGDEETSSNEAMKLCPWIRLPPPSAGSGRQYLRKDPASSANQTAGGGGNEAA